MSSTLFARMRIGVFNPSLARLITFSLITLFILTACSKEDDTEQIRKLIKEGAKLAEEHSAAGLLKLTTEDFVAQPGKHDGREVRRILWYAFNYYGNFKVMYPRGWLEEVGETADLYRLKLELLKNNGDWLVRSALLEPFRGVGFRG